MRAKRQCERTAEIGEATERHAMYAKPLPPLDEIRKRISYDPETGILTRIKGGKKISSYKDGYVRLYLANKEVAAHRVAWALYHGELPPTNMDIDHINRIRDDNRICNLRLVSKADNMKNKTQYSNNLHGYPGIIFEHDCNRVRKWRAQIHVNKKAIKLGSYMCKTAAIFARKRAEIEYGFNQFAGDKKWQLCMK